VKGAPAPGEERAGTSFPFRFPASPSTWTRGAEDGNDSFAAAESAERTGSGAAGASQKVASRNAEVRNWQTH